MPENPSCQARRDGDLLIFEPVGYLDDARGIELKRVYAKAQLAGLKGVLFDFGKCIHINSTGIACLMEVCENLVDSRGVKVGFCKISPIMREAFDIVGFGQFVEMFIDEAEGRRGLEK